MCKVSKRWPKVIFSKQNLRKTLNYKLKNIKTFTIFANVAAKLTSKPNIYVIHFYRRVIQKLLKTKKVLVSTRR